MYAIRSYYAYGIFPDQSLPIIYAYMGTVATATGDTLASEIGTTAKGRPRMITTLKLSEPVITSYSIHYTKLYDRVLTDCRKYGWKSYRNVTSVAFTARNNFV